MGRRIKRRNTMKRESMKRKNTMKRKSMKRNNTMKRKSMKRNNTMKRKSMKRKNTMKRRNSKRNFKWGGAGALSEIYRSLILTKVNNVDIQGVRCEVQVSVTFIGDGKLGIDFIPDTDNNVIIKEIKEEGLAKQEHPQVLKQGMILTKVNNKDFSDIDDAITKIRDSGRPLILTFLKVDSAPTDDAETRAAEELQVSVTFTEDGKLGIDFIPDKNNNVIINEIKEVGLAKQEHSQVLKQGMILTKVNTEDFSDIDDAVNKITNSDRPLTLTFLKVDSAPTDGGYGGYE